MLGECGSQVTKRQISWPSAVRRTGCCRICCMRRVRAFTGRTWWRRKSWWATTFASKQQSTWLHENDRHSPESILHTTKLDFMVCPLCSWISWNFCSPPTIWLYLQASPGLSEVPWPMLRFSLPHSPSLALSQTAAVAAQARGSTPCCRQYLQKPPQGLSLCSMNLSILSKVGHWVLSLIDFYGTCWSPYTFYTKLPEITDCHSSQSNEVTLKGGMQLAKILKSSGCASILKRKLLAIIVTSASFKRSMVASTHSFEVSKANTSAARCDRMTVHWPKQQPISKMRSPSCGRHLASCRNNLVLATTSTDPQPPGPVDQGSMGSSWSNLGIQPMWGSPG